MMRAMRARLRGSPSRLRVAVCLDRPPPLGLQVSVDDVQLPALAAVLASHSSATAHAAGQFDEARAHDRRARELTHDLHHLQALLEQATDES